MSIIYHHTADDIFDEKIPPIELKRKYDVLVMRQWRFPNIYPHFDLTFEEWEQQFRTIWYKHFPDITISDYSPTEKVRKKPKPKTKSINLQRRPKRPVIIDGVHYDSANDAGQAYELLGGTVRARVCSGSETWKNWVYA